MNAWSRLALILFKLHTTFNKLTVGKIIKIVATRCHILMPKCNKIRFRMRYRPRPLGELTALGLRGLLLREGREGRRGGKGNDKQT